MALVTSKFELPLQNFETEIYINRDFFIDEPLPIRADSGDFWGGQGGTLSATVIGHPELLGGKISYTIGAMHPVYPLTDSGFPATTSVRDGGGFGVWNDAGDSAILSAVGIAYNYSEGMSGVSHTTRKLYLSTGPRSNVGTHRQQQTSLLTHLSASFELGVLWKDGSMSTYHVPSLNVPSHDRGGATANPLSAVSIREFNLGTTPSQRRLWAMGMR